MLLFSLCVTHVGAVIFNRFVRRVSVLPRMLPAMPDHRLVNRVPIATQLMVAFGAVMAIAIAVGLNAVITYRELNRATADYQASDVAVADQMRSAQLAWKELAGTAALGRVEDAARLQELLDSAKYSLEDAVTHLRAGEIKSGINGVLGAIAAAAPADGAFALERLQAIDVALQELVDSQSAIAFQHRTDNEERAARGHDLIVVTVLPMVLAGLMAGLLLAHSVTGSLRRMSTLIRNIESDQRDSPVQVIGAGEIAGLTRDIVNMRAAVEERGNAAAAQRAQFDAERLRLAEQQQEREITAARRQRAERQVHRERLAQDFELQVTGIVHTVAQTATKLTSTAGTMANSASATTQRSREASSVAQQTSETASLIANGAAQLSNTAQSVRENADKSKARAVLAVQEAAAAKEQIDQLVDAARQISTITEIIASVARQTNMLAINTRIEAARAGEAGRGFAVLANEVKSLADRTRNATDDIGKQIEQMNSAATRSSDSLVRLRDVMAGLEGAAAAIFKATDEQLASTRSIASRVSDISTSAGSVARNIRDAQDNAGTTERMSEEVMLAAEVVNEQAEELREQVAGFVMQLRDQGAVAASDTAVSTQEAAPELELEMRRVAGHHS